MTEDIRTLAPKEAAEQIIAKFRGEKPRCDAAVDVDHESLGLEWRFADGTKFWLELEENGEIGLYWRPADVGVGRGRSLHFTPRPG